MRSRLSGAGVACLIVVLAMCWTAGAQETQPEKTDTETGEERNGRVELDLFFPTQLTRGQRTEVRSHLAEAAQPTGAEVQPAEGVTVLGIEAGEGRASEGFRVWVVTLEVAADAAPGEREVVITTSLGATAAQTVVLPPHVPVLSDFKVLSATMRPLKLEFSFVVTDVAGDLGAEPGLDSFLDCAGSVMGTMGRATVGPGGLIQESIGSESSYVTEETTCTLELTVTDTNGYKGGLTTEVHFVEEP